MRFHVLITLYYLIFIYWAIYLLLLGTAAVRHGIAWHKFRIKQKPKENFKLVKGVILGIAIVINYNVLKYLPSVCIDTLGKNNLISPYIFFALLMFAAEYIGFLFIVNDFKFSELNIGGARWTQNDELGFMEYKELSETTLSRIRIKLMSSNKLMTSLNDICREAIEKTKKSSDIKPYIDQLQKAIDEYVKMQNEDKEKNLKVKIYLKDDKLYDIIKQEYKLSNYDFKRIQDDVINGKGLVILEESEQKVIAMAIPSKLLPEPYIVVISHTDSFILSDEATIVQSILIAIDQAVEVGLMPNIRK